MNVGIDEPWHHIAAGKIEDLFAVLLRQIRTNFADNAVFNADICHPVDGLGRIDQVSVS